VLAGGCVVSTICEAPTFHLMVAVPAVPSLPLLLPEGRVPPTPLPDETIAEDVPDALPHT
jgi:hypothetical protein